MIATGTTLGCGMSIFLAVFAADAQATETNLPPAVRYEFAEGTVIVQPGLPSPSKRTPQSAVKDTTAGIQLANYVQLPLPPLPLDTALQEVPVDAALATSQTSPADSPAAETSAGNSAPATDAAARVRLYREVYNSIPFSRAEFNANPSYRHDATMEFLFGEMRPTVIHRQPSTRVDINMPAMPYGGFGYGSGLIFNRYGLYNNWSPYMYPPYRW
ncbi:MAG TPA: hypothetical protein VFG20_21450 [Planctomycetaceae bacterium]|nr:hypothetical protein [Planctomycetaceae bacterium]